MLFLRLQRDGTDGSVTPTQDQGQAGGDPARDTACAGLAEGLSRGHAREEGGLICDHMGPPCLGRDPGPQGRPFLMGIWAFASIIGHSVWGLLTGFGGEWTLAKAGSRCDCPQVACHPTDTPSSALRHHSEMQL